MYVAMDNRIIPCQIKKMSPSQMFYLANIAGEK